MGELLMLLSIALILLISITLSQLFEKIRLPGLVGMLLTGIVLGPFVLNLISPTLLNISGELRQIALIVILIRAGLSLNIKDLLKVGRPALLLCFVPATFEIIAVTLLGPVLFGVSYLDAALMGTVLAAVSPAVVVPRMIKLMESGYGRDKSIPQMIMAGASADDIFVIVLFYSFLHMENGTAFSPMVFLNIPLSVVSGILLGIATGFIFVWFTKKIHLRDTLKVLIMFGLAFLFVVLENILAGTFAISGLIAVIAFGSTVLARYESLAKRLVGKFGKIWVLAEIILFVMVGASVDITVLGQVGVEAVLLIFGALLIRLVGVFVTLIKTTLSFKEKVFVALSYIPKATVQAAIGAIPLSMGLGVGNLILVVAVLAIAITAPLGAFFIDLTYKKFLAKNT